MHIVVAIPTYNRIERLKIAFESILSQKLNNNIKLSICISNSASTDKTAEYLKDLNNNYNNLYLFNTLLNNRYQNFGCLASIIPQDADWVWFMGDDDYLVSNEAIEKVCNLINGANKKLSFIHVTQKRRSDESNSVLYDSVKNLCNNVGYHEIIGWISSLVMRRQFFVNALKNHQDKANTNWESISAFNHSFFFYAEIHDKLGAFYDHGLVEPQDLIQTQDSLKKWAEEKIPEKYLLVMDDFSELNKLKLLPQKINATFFRYINYHFWDRWLIYLLNETVREDISFENKMSQAALTKYDAYWKKLLDFTNLITDMTLKKFLSNEIKSSMALCLKFLFDVNSRDLCKVLIKDKIKLLQQSSYSIKTKIV